MPGRTGKAIPYFHPPDRRFVRIPVFQWLPERNPPAKDTRFVGRIPTSHIRARVPGVQLADVRCPRARQTCGIRLGHREFVRVLVDEWQPARIRIEPEVVVRPVFIAQIPIVRTGHPVNRSTTWPATDKERCQSILGHVLKPWQILQPRGLVTHGSPEQANVLPQPSENQKRPVTRPLGNRWRTGTGTKGSGLVFGYPRMNSPGQTRSSPDVRTATSRVSGPQRSTAW